MLVWQFMNFIFIKTIGILHTTSLYIISTSSQFIQIQPKCTTPLNFVIAYNH